MSYKNSSLLPAWEVAGWLPLGRQLLQREGRGEDAKTCETNMAIMNARNRQV